MHQPRVWARSNIGDCTHSTRSVTPPSRSRLMVSGHATCATGTAFGALGLAERASGANTQKPHTVYRQTRRRVCKPHLPVYTHPTRLWIIAPCWTLLLGCPDPAPRIRRGPTRTSCCCRRHTIPYSKFDIAHGRSLTRPGAEGHIHIRIHRHRPRGSDQELRANFSTLFACSSVPRGVLCSSDTMTVATTRSHTRRAGTLLGRNPLAAYT